MWAEVIECDNREQIQSLLDEIPISVMAKHAISAMESPKKNPSFGNLISQVVWPESSNDDEPSTFCERLIKTYRWKDTSGQFEVEARIFDVRQSSVILKKGNDSLVEVPIDRLSKSSSSRLKHYRSIRQKIAERIPDKKSQITSLIAERMAVVLKRLSTPKLLQTMDWLPKTEPSRKDIRFDKTGSRLIAGSINDLALWDLKTGELIRQRTSGIPAIDAPTTRHNSLHHRIQWNIPPAGGHAPLPHLFDIERDKWIYKFTAADFFGPLQSGLVSRNGTTAAWIAFSPLEPQERVIQVFDTKSKDPKPKIIAKLKTYEYLFGLSSDGSRLVTFSMNLSNDSTNIKFWDTTTAKLIRETKPDEIPFQMVAPNLEMQILSRYYPLSPDGQRIVVLDFSRDSLYMLKLANGKRQDFDSDFITTWNEGQKESIVAFLEFTPSGRQLILATNKSVCIWDIAQKKTIIKWERTQGTKVVDIRISPDESKLAILTLTRKLPFLLSHVSVPDAIFGMGDGLESWELTSGQPLEPIPVEKNEIINGFEFSPDSKHIATSCYKAEDNNALDEPKSSVKIWRLPK